MGASLLIVSIGSLLVMWFVDFFTNWYAKFLKRWMPYFKIRVLLGHLVWAILAFFFWNSMAENNIIEQLNPTYFFFVMFIYSVRGLIDSFIKNRDERSIYY